MLTSSPFELFFDCVALVLLPFMAGQIAVDLGSILAGRGDGGSGC